MRLKRSSFLAGPRPDVARQRYRAHATRYDAASQRTMPLRLRTVARLGLQPGDTVLDVACGTGLSFGLLQQGVGETGRIIGVELSPDMLARARQRVEGAGWHNVALLESALETAEIPALLDAVLFNYTHDVLRSPIALARIFAAARPGARVAVAGMQLMRGWRWPLNVLVLAKAWPYMTTFEGLGRPWSLLEAYLEGFEWEPTQFGMGYIGHGVVRGAGT